MNEKMIVTDTKPTYANLKNKETELLTQLKDLREVIANVEHDIIKEKLNTAIQYLIDVDEMTHGFYHCTIETYCEECHEYIDSDMDLSEIIKALQRIN